MSNSLLNPPGPKIGKRPQPPPQQPGGIYWLASFPRSGNTWLRVFIHNLLDDVLGSASPEEGINALDRYTAVEAELRYFLPYLGKSPDGTDWQAVANVRPLVQRALARSKPGTLFVKTHAALLSTRGVPAISPEVTVGAVHLVRNPLDVVCSYAPHFGFTIDQAIDLMASKNNFFRNRKGFVFELVSSWSENVDSWTREKSPAVCVLRYEDMIADPRTAFTAFVRHAGIKATPAQIKRAIEKSSFDRLKKAEAEGGFRERPAEASASFFRSGRSGGWRETLTAEQVGRIVSAHEPVMRQFGYLDGL
jgi:hypothetical protein